MKAELPIVFATFDGYFLLSDDNQSEVIEALNSSSRYLDDLLNIDNTFFDSMVFQRRLDGSEDFYRDLFDYERGFGNVSHEYWLGFLPLRRILGQGHYELRIDLEDWEGETRYARYNLFSTSDSDDKYRLKVLSYTGDAGNSLENHNEQMFTTKDNDNDDAENNCAENHDGAWWYYKCMTSNLNGKYYYENGTVHANGINWKKWTRNGKNTHYTLKKSEMKIRKV